MQSSNNLFHKKCFCVAAFGFVGCILFLCASFRPLFAPAFILCLFFLVCCVFKLLRGFYKIAWTICSVLCLYGDELTVYALDIFQNRVPLQGSATTGSRKDLRYMLISGVYANWVTCRKTQLMDIMHRALKNFELYDCANSKTSWIMLDQPKRADGHRIRMKHIEALSNHRWWVQESLPRRQSASWIFWSRLVISVISDEICVANLLWQRPVGTPRQARVQAGLKESRCIPCSPCSWAAHWQVDQLIRLYCLPYASCKVVVISLQSRSPSPVSHRCPGEWFCWTCLDMGHGCWHFTAFPMFFPFPKSFCSATVANKWQTSGKQEVEMSWISLESDESVAWQNFGTEAYGRATVRVSRFSTTMTTPVQVPAFCVPFPPIERILLHKWA